jgi:hypothetical protein
MLTPASQAKSGIAGENDRSFCVDPFSCSLNPNFEISSSPQLQKIPKKTQTGKTARRAHVLPMASRTELDQFPQAVPLG